MALMRDRSYWVRVAAARSLGKLLDTRAVETLIAALDDRNRDVRRSAATALGKLRDPRAVDGLSAALADSWWRVGESAEKALRALRAAPRVEPLIERLTHTDPDVRMQAASRLGALGDGRAVEPLVGLVEDRAQPSYVRQAALKALGALRDARGAPVVLRELERLGVKRSIAESMGEDASLRAELATTLGSVGDAAATPALVALLDDANPYVRHAAITSLATIGDASAIPALERVQQTDPASVAVDYSGMQQVRLRSVAADAIRRIRERAGAA